MNNIFSCETVDGGCFAFAPLVGSNLFCQRTSQLGESACHMPISYRFILLETSAAGLPGNYLYSIYVMRFGHFGDTESESSGGKVQKCQVTKAQVKMRDCSEGTDATAGLLVLATNGTKWEVLRYDSRYVTGRLQ